MDCSYRQAGVERSPGAADGLYGRLAADTDIVARLGSEATKPADGAQTRNPLEATLLARKGIGVKDKE